VPDTVKQPPNFGALKGLLRLVMSLRNITGTYTRTQGTILPGFTQSPYLFGMNKDWNAPGWGFVLGQQDPTINLKAAERGWLSKSERLTMPFSQTDTRDYSVKASLEPSTDFKIQLDARKTTNSSYQTIFKFSPSDSLADPITGFTAQSPNRNGAYKVSILSINTAFKNNTSTESTVFKQFEQNIQEIKNRFNSVSQGYETKSQDVLIPAFLAAYTGKSADRVPLTPFPKLPIPGWRIDYSGLSKLNGFKDIFQSVTLNHAYSSTYSVMNFSNSLEYANVGIDVPLESYNNNQFASVTNADGNLIPIYVINSVLISETFAPLIGVNIRTKGKLSLRFEYKTKRDLSLTISNAQITEVNSKDWSVEIGYTKNNMRLPFRDQGAILTLKNDITFRLNMSVTNNRTIQRKIDEVDNITNGNINFQLRPNVNYVINQKLNIQFYFDRNINEPLVTNSFPRATTKAGFKILFNLAQ
jgi:cell surface protein SprA